MATKIQKLKWDLHQKRYKMLLLYGLQHGLIFPYLDELINPKDDYVFDRDKQLSLVRRLLRR